MSARHGLLLSVTAIVCGLTACGSTPPAAPGSVAQPSAAPTSATTAPTSTAPTSTAPADGAAGSESPATTAAGGPGTGARNCPSAKALERLVDLPNGYHFIPSSVECWKGWATADPEGPIVGDGIYLFQYKAGTGWRHHSEGSGYHCKDLGITSGNPPFCTMD